MLALGLVSSLLMGACASGDREVPDPGRLDPYARSEAATRSISATADDPILRREAARDLGRMGGEEAAETLLAMLDDPDPDVAAEAAFGLAISEAHNAAGRLVANLPADAPGDVVDAAVLGLGNGAGDEFERALVTLAREFDSPAGVPNALFNHYRWRGRAAPKVLPDDILLSYETHPAAEGRAGFGNLRRAVKDARTEAALIRLLADDADPEVRRAAAMGLARSRDGEAKPRSQLGAALHRAFADTDARVVISACRALGSYEGTEEFLLPLLGHADFNVRAAAIQSLAGRKAEAAVERLAALATDDPSVFVRGSAITALAGLDAARAYELAPVLLADDAEFVRASACDALAVAPEDQADAATERLAALVFSDPHVRVRHSALDKLKGREGRVVLETVAEVLVVETDPVVVAVACDVVATDGMTELVGLVRVIPGRFPGRMNADARAGALGALGTIGEDMDEALLREYMSDPDPSVAMTAQNALAKRGGVKSPTPRRTGVRGAEHGDLMFFTGGGFLHFVVETTRGTMTFELDVDAAPLHVAHVAAFAGKGGYDGLSWHRVVPDFVIQGGCPRGDGSGGAGVTLPLEPTRIPFERGVLGMPRSSHPDSGGCQLFVMHSRAPHLDVHYTAFGRLIDGDDVIDTIDVDDRIIRARIMVPIPAPELPQR